MSINQSRTFIFIVTKNCQFRCRYCYLVNKVPNDVMTVEVGHEAMNYILSSPDFNEDNVILDFIGGEPLLEIELIAELCDYFLLLAHKKSHRWAKNYTIRITTNGLIYNDTLVQTFIQKYKENLSISISLDGTKQKNDLNRIFESGNGTYDSIIDNVKLWLKQFPDSESRMTVSHDDLPYVFESALHLMELGIQDIDLRIVNENVWESGDDAIYESQLVKLADYIIYSDIDIKSLNITCFHEKKGLPITDDAEISCGNKTIAIDSKGYLYPCHRFASYSLRSKSPRIIGDIFHGINYNRMRAFTSFNVRLHNSSKCNKCEVSGDCRYCVAEDYDSADTDTIFQHSEAICNMHKAEVRAYNYFWRMYNQIN